MRHLKDYYHILGVDKSATADELKKAYRRLAVQCHPDHNPGDKTAEDKFKAISEAYAVLADPAKRLEYDRAWAAGPAPGGGPEPEFTFTQEDFQDVFARVFNSQAFRDLARDLERSGLRFDEKFFRHVFSGGRGFFFGGVFFSTGPFGTRVRRGVGPDYRTTFSERATAQARAARAGVESPPERPGWLTRLGRGTKALARTFLGLGTGTPALAADAGDINFSLAVTPREAGEGAEVQVVYDRDGQRQRVSVKVPPGTRPGARLRLKNMGHRKPDGRTGDLYLHVRITSP
ncbi:MAG: DnaJ domain-containing protein [Thermodesulfobacteriota bacterium]